jgi:transposase
MVGQGGTDHARHRTLSVPARLEVAMDREPCEPGHRRVLRGRVAEHAGDATWTCPHCAEPLPLYDHTEERTWRHLDSCQFQTYLHARIPRVACSEHGVVQVLVPWAEPRSRFTLLFERLAIDVLRQCDVSGATRILRIS